MLRRTIGYVTTLALLASLPGSSRVQAQQAEVETAAEPQKIEMTVLGLSCPFCAYGLEKKLRKVEGLTDLEIRFKTGRVVLEVKEGSEVTDERIRELVKEAGFEIEGAIERSPLPEGEAEEAAG